MPGALLGAVSCGRCGLPDAHQTACPRCFAPWLGAATDAGLAGAGPLLGVVRAGIATRVLAGLVDLAALGGLVGLAVRVGGSGRAVAAAAVVLLVVAQLWWLQTRGRTLGRWLLGQRTVDDLTGQPVRLRRLLHPLTAAGWSGHRLTADLRRGRDPLEPVLAVPAPLPAREGDAVAAGQAWTAARPSSSAPSAEAAPSVGIVLANGERYEVFGSLLLGRSPSDPGPDGGRALLAWPDLSRRLAKTHALLEWSGSVLWVTDLHTVTGTTLTSPDGLRRPLAPGVRVPAGVGWSLECGGRLVQVVPGG